MNSQKSGWAGLLLLFVLLFGAIVRFLPTIWTGVPINDGGMFYVMLRDLVASHFLLPAFTSYNNLHIPYVYPPFPFYIGGGLSVLGVSILDVLRWLPPLVSVLSIFAFYLLSELILESKTKAVLAAMAYALMPRSFSWYVMGGGLSRSFGVFFLLLTCAAAWRLFQQQQQKYVFLTAGFGAGVVLSHPEMALHAMTACVLIWLFKGRSLRSLKDAVAAAVGVVVLTAPWWIAVLTRHGFGPISSVLSTGAQQGLPNVSWFVFGFSEERFIPLFTLLGLAGFALQIMRRDWFLPIWLILPFVVEQRSAPAAAVFPLAILAGIGLSDLVISPLLTILHRDNFVGTNLSVAMAHSLTVRLVLGFVILYALFDALVYDISLTHYVYSSQDVVAMQWIRSHTSPSSRFIVLTGRQDPFADPSVEWFPAFSERMSLNTIQGREWQLGRNFLPFLKDLAALQTCINKNMSCVESWARTNHADFDYVYVEKPESQNTSSHSLAYELTQNVGYALVFQNTGVAIYRRR